MARSGTVDRFPTHDVYSRCCPLPGPVRDPLGAPAFILAGGVGSRLGPLTTTRPKPVMPFAGHHRLIDFTLSNCANSGVTDVTLLTQHLPAAIAEYVGDGAAWGLAPPATRLRVLPPPAGVLYRGTADAVRQRLPRTFEDARAVLVLAADHVYRMDYRALTQHHLRTGADITIAVIEVPRAEAHRFGVAHLAPDGSVLRFEEKPLVPTSTLASMGIYAFDPNRLRQLLAIDAAEPTTHDFGRDILPLALTLGLRVEAYRFAGYWRDVGTPESFWAAHGDLLAAEDHSLARIFDAPCIRRSGPVDFGTQAVARESAIFGGCTIDGTVERSVLSPGVYVARGAIVRDSVLLGGARVEEGAVVDHAVLDEHSVVGRFATVGVAHGRGIPHGGAPVVSVVGASARVRPGEVIVRGSTVGAYEDAETSRRAVERESYVA